MIGDASRRSSISSLLISVAIHCALIFLIPYIEPQVYEIIPLDIPGVVEIANIEGPPSSREPASTRAIDVQNTPVKPPALPEKPAPAVKDSSPDPKKEVSPEPRTVAVRPANPVSKPDPVVPSAPGPAPARTEQRVDQSEIMTGESGTQAVATTPAPAPAESMPPRTEPKPDPKSDAGAREAGLLPPTTGSQAASGDGVGLKDGQALVPPPAPNYPGDDRSGAGMIKSYGPDGSSGQPHVPKDLSSRGVQGTALVRVKISASGRLQLPVEFLEPPPHKEMERYLETYLRSWEFKPDTTPGHADYYFLEIRVAYDGGGEAAAPESKRAYYRP